MQVLPQIDLQLRQHQPRGRLTDLPPVLESPIKVLEGADAHAPVESMASAGKRGGLGGAGPPASSQKGSDP
jgi:hypothetical protein